MTKIEDQFADMREHIDEVCRSMVILQQAIRNEYEPTELQDIDNYLEIVINKINETIKIANELNEKLFTKNKIFIPNEKSPTQISNDHIHSQRNSSLPCEGGIEGG